jgi:integrase
LDKKKKENRYRSRIYLGTDPDGKRRYKYVYGRTQKEVREKEAQVRAQLLKGVNVADAHTFGYYRMAWLARKQADVSPLHYDRLVSVSKHLAPLEPMKVRDIKPSMVEDILLRLAARNPHTGKPTSKKTLGDVLHSADQIFRVAMEDRELDYNPCYSLRVPKSAPVSKREPITEEQVRWIRETPDRCQTAAMIMLYAGLRKSEVTALTALDVNLRDKTIRVNKKAVFDGGSVQIVHETKTKAGNRLVSIPDLLVDYLSICPRDRTYIAFNTDQPLNRYRWQSWWSSYMDELDLKYGVRVRQPTSKFDPVRRGGHVIQEFTPHQLRHTYCSMLYDAGVDVLTAKELMGHEDVQTTLGIYTHLSKARKAKSIESLNEYLA